MTYRYIVQSRPAPAYDTRLDAMAPLKDFYTSETVEISGNSNDMPLHIMAKSTCGDRMDSTFECVA